MTFKQEMESMSKARRLERTPSAAEMYKERWSALDKFKNPSSAAGTEKAIVSFLQMKGHHAAKVEVKGTYVAPDWEKTAMGRIQTKKGMFLPSGARKGSADISASIHGIAVHIEVKYSKTDRQSVHQKAFEADVNESGGIYFIVHSVDDFYVKYFEMMNHPRIVLMRDYELKNPSK